MADVTIQRAFELALEHHQAGQLQKAEQIYREILAKQPAHAESTHGLGMIAYQVGRADIAIDFIRRAIALNPNFPEAHNNLGNALCENKQFEEAIAAYRRAVAIRLDYVEAHNNLGIVLTGQGRLDEAISAFRRAISLRPTYAEAHSNLGNALRSKGELDEAIAACCQAISVNPNYAQALNNLGNALSSKKQFDDAIATYRRALSIKPDYAEVHNNLGNTFSDKGQFTEAIIAYRQALLLNPNYAEAQSNLGNALRSSGQLAEAIAACRLAIALKSDLAEAHSNLGTALQCKGELDEAIVAYRQAIALRPNSAEAHNNLASALKDKGELDEAVTIYRKAIAINPDLPESHNNLGNALRDGGLIDDAIAAFHHALLLNPNFAEAHNNLGNALSNKGRIDDAIAAYRQAVALKSNFAEAHSNLVFALHLHPDYNAQAIGEELRRWNRQHAEPLRKFIQPHSNDRSPGRRLRIGYVSPDLRDNVVGQNFLPLLEQHDRRQFDITCYAHVIRPDAMTRRLQQHADCWRNIVGLSDEEVAKQVGEDRIDLLVDLALHTGQNRLLVFARKPAPVQVTYLAYCGSSGMTAMDYRLSDPHLDPPGTDLSCYSEKTLLLPRTYWCYQPAGPAAEPSQTPAIGKGFVIFGCLNNYAKVSPAALDLWARILVAVPNSRMIIHASPGTHVDEAVGRLEQSGVAQSRVTFVARQAWAGYTQTYSQIDIALDSFPYAGGITTCAALWMGVPVVTLSGETAVGRGGRSILSNVGLPELIAFTPDEYAHIAIELANDLDRMNSLRQSMRARVLASPLMDAKGFARDMEAAYRQMWHAWCESVSTTI